jgi:hypothetical protein
MFLAVNQVTIFIPKLHFNKNTLVLYINDTPATCFGLQWPSPGNWIKKETVVVNYITDVNHLPEDGYCRPKHVGGVPYDYKTAVLLQLCGCWHNMSALCHATEHFTLDIISL